MRKENWIKKKTKVLCAGFMAAMLIAGTTACGNSSDSTLSEADQVTAEAQPEGATESTKEGSFGQSMETGNMPQEMADAVFGRIMAIDGNTITIALAEMPQMSGRGNRTDGARPEGQDGEMPTGEMPEMDESQLPDREIPEGEMPTGELPGGGTPGGGMADGEMSQMELTITGETMDIVVSDSTVITINSETATVSDLAVDDTVTIQMDGDEVTSITVGFGGAGAIGQ